MPTTRRHQRRPAHRECLLALSLALAAHAALIYILSRNTLSGPAEPATVSNGIFTAETLANFAPNIPPQPPAKILQPPAPAPPPIPEPIPIPTPLPEPNIPPPVITSVSHLPNLPTIPFKPATKPRHTTQSTSPSNTPTTPRHGGASSYAAGLGSSGNSGNTGIQYLYNPHPPYPPDARAMRQQGVVIVAADISSSGHVTHAEVSRTSGFPLLDQAAVCAVRQWLFTPARHQGLPTAAHVEIPVRFSLSA